MSIAGHYCGCCDVSIPTEAVELFGSLRRGTWVRISSGFGKPEVKGESVEKMVYMVCDLSAIMTDGTLIDCQDAPGIEVVKDKFSENPEPSELCLKIIDQNVPGEEFIETALH